MPHDIAAAAAPSPVNLPAATLSPWWRRASLLTMALGFSVLILLTVKVYYDAPPIPDKVVGPDELVFYTGADIRNGQQVFLKYGLMPIAIVALRACCGRRQVMLGAGAPAS